MSTLRPELPPLPERFKNLPLSERGYPVPWFVAWLDENNEPCPRGEGKAEFRITAPGAVAEAWNHQKCWLCGERTGAYVAFVLGPMCAVNRVNSEPPSHRDCADFAARACPFLARPHAKRRPVGDDVPTGDMPGLPIMRNPGAAGVWVTKRNRIRPFRIEGGVLFSIGDPTEVLWYAEGRPATREEVERSIESGMPLLQESAAGQGRGAERALAKQAEAVKVLLPG